MNTTALDSVSVLWLMQHFAALGVTETFMRCVAGTYQIELGIDDNDHSRVVLGTSRVDMIHAMSDLLVKLDAVDATRSALRMADAADPDGAQPISARSILEIARDGAESHDCDDPDCQRCNHAPPPDVERCSICKEPAHPSETNDRGDHESCADAQRRGDDA